LLLPLSDIGLQPNSFYSFPLDLLAVHLAPGKRHCAKWRNRDRLVSTASSVSRKFSWSVWLEGGGSWWKGLSCTPTMQHSNTSARQSEQTQSAVATSGFKSKCPSGPSWSWEEWLKKIVLEDNNNKGTLMPAYGLGAFSLWHFTSSPTSEEVYLRL